MSDAYTVAFPNYETLLPKGKEIALVVKHATSPLQWEGTLFVSSVITGSEFFKTQNMKQQEAMDYIHDLLMYGIQGHPDIYANLRIAGSNSLAVKCVAKNTQVSVSVTLTLNTTASLQGALESLATQTSAIQTLERRIAGLEAVFSQMVSQNVQIVEAPAATAATAESS